MADSLTARLPADWATAFMSIRSTPLFTALYDRLVAWSREGEVVPSLAESWVATPEQIVFTIKRGVTASDGVSVGPLEIARSLRHALDPDTTSRLPAFTGPGPFTVTADETAGTVTVRTETPNSDLLAAFAGVNAVIIPPEKKGDGAELDPDAAGTGPYVLDEVTSGERVRLRRRPGYDWGPPMTDPDRFPGWLEFRVVADDAEAAALVLAGELQIARLDAVPPELAADPGVRLKQSSSTIANQVICNLAREPFRSNRALRLALFTALDRRRVLEAEVGPSALLTNSVFAPGMDHYADLGHLIPKPSMDAARALMEEAGYTEGAAGQVDARGEALTVDLLASSAQGSGPAYIRETLTALGVRVLYREQFGSDYSHSFIRGEFDMAIFSGAGSSPAPTNMSRFISGDPFEAGGSNYLRVADPVFDQLARDASAAVGERRAHLWSAFQARYLEQAYGLPTGARVGWFALRGCDVSPLGDIYEAWSIRCDRTA